MGPQELLPATMSEPIKVVSLKVKPGHCVTVWLDTLDRTIQVELHVDKNCVPRVCLPVEDCDIVHTYNDVYGDIDKSGAPT